MAALEEAARQGASLACYAELAFDWFHPQRPAGTGVRDLAEPIDGPTVHAFQAKARELGIVVVLNLFERDGDRTFDSSPVIDADGALLGVTRMVHITDYACFHEQGYYTPATRARPSTPRARAASALRSATTATSPSTCAGWRWAAPIW
jgi:predicted amidohydrolase